MNAWVGPRLAALVADQQAPRVVHAALAGEREMRAVGAAIGTAVAVAKAALGH
ncbi:hypothetical protein [Streptomyces sp. NPDC086989]|uniref:hypothetical protein n=1 Tax=Streptomyces sp. NPDC086989 TaxID=3365764 RepID=UPI0037F9FB63